MALISVTRLRLRSFIYLPLFFNFAYLSRKEAMKAKGNISTKVVDDSNHTFWTITIWESIEDMKEFMYSGSHHQAIKKLYQWCDEATFVHWTQASTDFPDWETIYSKLTKDGTVSKVKSPSPNHKTKSFPKPRFK